MLATILVYFNNTFKYIRFLILNNHKRIKINLKTRDWFLFYEILSANHALKLTVRLMHTVGLTDAKRMNKCNGYA